MVKVDLAAVGAAAEATRPAPSDRLSDFVKRYFQITTVPSSIGSMFSPLHASCVLEPIRSAKGSAPSQCGQEGRCEPEG
jgi:hypothetical protein